MPPTVYSALIVGFPRSGTTLLRAVLDRHSALQAVPWEPHFIPDLLTQFGLAPVDRSVLLDALSGHASMPAPLSEALPAILPSASTLTLRAGLDAVFSHLFDGQATGVVVKVPRLVYNVPAVRALFPEAHVVHLVRDPRGALASHLARWPGEGLWGRLQDWKAAVQAGHTWTTQHPEDALELRFEDLLRTPEASLKQLCTFLSIPYEPTLLDVELTTMRWARDTPANPAEVRYQGFETEKIDQWRTVLRPSEVHLIERTCQAEMDVWNYVKADIPASPLGVLALYTRSRLRAWYRALRS